MILQENLSHRKFEYAQTAEARLLASTVRSLAEEIVSTTDTRRTDRLWPADAMIFQTNALNIAYGACGTAIFLHQVFGELPANVREWLLAQKIDHHSYPPGLYSGIAGVAWCLAEMGMPERAAELFEMVPESPLAFHAADLFNGAAGWGFAALAFYLRTREDRYLALAHRAAEFLAQSAERDSSGACWRDQDDGVVRLGFALGGCGIAYFLLSLWRLTREDRYLALAIEALEFELANAQVRGNTLVWGSFPNSGEHRPYWLRGGAGVASTLIRFATVLDDARYLELAHKAGAGCAVFFSVAPHLFEGLASMGETLLDMYLATGEESYFQAARQKAQQILLYRIERPNGGAAFPGRYLVRISHDFGLGGAGIGLYFRRLLNFAPRPFHDIFDTPPAALFAPAGLAATGLTV